MKRKFISALTALTMMFSLVPTVFAANTAGGLYSTWTEAAQAAVAGTDYTQSDLAYTIKTAKGLAWLANEVNNGQTLIYVTLANNIDLSGVVDDRELTEENSWVPIGQGSKNGFQGIFDGKGYTISGMKINNSQLYQGLFGYVKKGSSIKDVKINNAQINLMEINYNDLDSFPSSYCGGIAGYNAGTITNCETSLEMGGGTAGGIVGGNNGAVEHCKNTGNISGTSDVGGIAGHNSGTITDCENSGNMTGVFCIGGIAGNTSTSTIRDCSNSGVITGQLWIGGIAGLTAYKSTVEDCENAGNVVLHSMSFSYLPSCGEAGGITGRIDSYQGYSEVKRCYNSGYIASEDEDAGEVGGIVGLIHVYGSIYDCVNDGNVSSRNWDAGGIVGEISVTKTDNNSVVINCVNNGNVTANKYAGGIAGSSIYKIENSYNTGNVSAKESAGGIVGINTVLLNNPSVFTGSVENCYSTGTVTADSNAGGIAGKSGNRVSNCYYPAGQNAAGTGTVKNCAAFNSNNVLEDGRPLYQALNDNVDASSNRKQWAASHEAPAVFMDDVFLSWIDAGNAAQAGTDYDINGNTYTIYTPLGLAFIANTVNGGDTLQGKTVLLNNDIDLSGVVNDTDLNDKNSWNPIGETVKRTVKTFNGAFDGQGYTVSGMKTNRHGFIGTLGTEGELRNVTIANSKVIIPNSSSYNGLTVALLVTENNGIISNCHTDNKSEVTSRGNAVAGIAGENSGIIENCSNAADLTSVMQSAGGIVACNDGGTIKNCRNSGVIMAKDRDAAGIVAIDATYDEESFIINCVNEGDIYGSDCTGGIVGWSCSFNNKKHVIMNCYNTASVHDDYNRAGGIGGSLERTDIRNCYNSGSVTATKKIAGSIIGYARYKIDVDTCYYLSSSAPYPIGETFMTYEPTNCHMFDENGVIIGTEKTLSQALNDGVHMLNNKEAFTWTKGDGFAEFGVPLSEALEVSLIKLAKSPASTYIQGQTFNPEGMIITLWYSNGSQVDVAYTEENKDDFTFTPSLGTALTTSDTEIEAVYEDCTVIIPITVSEKNITSINVSSLPQKTTYVEGQELDTTGIGVTAQYNNGTSEVIENFDISGYDKNEVGNQDVTVTFGGFTASFTVTVKAKTATGISIISEPSQKEYIEGTQLNLAGLVVQAQYDNATSAVVTDYTVDGYDKNTTGKQTVTVSYSGFTAQFDVTVVEKKMTGISVDTSKVKTSLIEGESLDARPLIVTAEYDNGMTENIPVADCKLSGYNRNVLGVQTVTVVYNGFKTQFDVTVAEKTLTGIKILLAPPKVEYIEGEELNTSGLVVWAQYDNGRGQNVLASVTGYDKNKLGTQLVSVEYGGFTAEYTVTVYPKELTGLTITRLPNKRTYLESEVLDLSGMIVSASYNNGTTENVTGYVVDEFDNYAIGTQTIEVKYGGKVATFDVEVTPKSLSSIRVTKKPDRTNYIVGQELDTTGMELTAYYNNGTTELIDDYTVTGYDKDKLGAQTVNVEYEGFTTKLNVTVVDKSVTDIAITAQPTKTDYIEGQELELAGLVVTANYDNGTSANVTGYDITGYDKNTAGTQTVTVAYAGQTATFTVNVAAKVLKNIMITKLPLKTDYIEDEVDELDLTGICVIANYDNGISEEITDYEISKFDNMAVGMQIIVLTYKDATASFGVNVTQKKMMQLAITSMPEQIMYVQGQDLNISGMAVVASYDNGKSESITAADCKITGYDENVVGLQTVFVEYGSMSDSFNIIVTENKANTPRINAAASLDQAQNTAEITAAPENCGAGVVIAALYKDDVLIAVKSVDYNGTDAPEALRIPYTVEPDKIKVMLWDSLEGMKWLCEAETPQGY